MSQQAIDTRKDEKAIHQMAYKPIHEYLMQIVPYLEQRQQIAKKLTLVYGKDGYDTQEAMLKHDIDYMNEKIREILSANPFIHTT